MILVNSTPIPRRRNYRGFTAPFQRGMDMSLYIYSVGFLFIIVAIFGIIKDMGERE